MLDSRIRAAVESLYKGLCTVYVQKEVTDPITHITSFAEEAAMENIPCRLSFSTIYSAQEGVADGLKQVTKLFIAPEIRIPAGSKIVVTQENVTTAYVRSGEPAYYESHQEIVLNLFERYA